jgi:hypothetical protein
MRYIAFAATILSGFLFVEGSAVAQSQRSPQQPKLPTIRKNMPYADARAALIKAGFRPIAFPKVEDEDESDGRCGSRSFICEAYPETEACAGTGLGQCNFAFSGGPNVVVRITTGGEELEDLVVLAVQRKQCSVDQVRRDACP